MAPVDLVMLVWGGGRGAEYLGGNISSTGRLLGRALSTLACGLQVKWPRLGLRVWEPTHRLNRLITMTHAKGREALARTQHPSRARSKVYKAISVTV